MNREIKFRGKRLDNGEWLFGDLLRIAEHTFIFPNPAPDGFDRYMINPDIVGQYTGLIDHGNKEIYEGDILNLPFGKVRVIWNGYGWAYHREGTRIYSDGSMDNVNICNMRFAFGQGIICGNIHDNPELLKGGNE